MLIKSKLVMPGEVPPDPTLHPWLPHLYTHHVNKVALSFAWFMLEETRQSKEVDGPPSVPFQQVEHGSMWITPAVGWREVTMTD